MSKKETAIVKMQGGGALTEGRIPEPTDRVVIPTAMGPLNVSYEAFAREGLRALRSILAADLRDRLARHREAEAAREAQAQAEKSGK